MQQIAAIKNGALKKTKIIMSAQVPIFYTQELRLILIFWKLKFIKM